jgi:hypothetical protein
VSNRIVLSIAVAACLGALSSGCDGPPTIASPRLEGTPPLAPPPPPPPRDLSIASIVPNVGSSLGTTFVQIIGTGFQSGVTVKLDGITVESYLNAGYIHAISAAHVEGTVDVTVENPDGLSVTKAAGYTFASPDSFDFNGTWISDEGYGVLAFTILNDTLVSITCDGATLIPEAPQPRVKDGKVSYVDSARGSLSAHIASASIVVGELKLCRQTWFWAWRG